MPTVTETLRRGAEALRASGVSDPEWDAERLLRHVLGWNRAGLLAHGEEALAREHRLRFEALIAERAARRPLQQLVGVQAFWHHEFLVTPDVLIPRPETEILVEAALRCLAGRVSPVVVDVGTGSGNIALSLAHARPDAEVHATDISAPALAVARRNAGRLGLATRVRFYEGDLLTPVASLAGRVDLVAANPPYVAAGDTTLAPEVRAFEPATALFAPGEPFSIYRRLAPSAHDIMAPGGWLLMEVGAGMAAEVERIVGSAGFTVQPPVEDLAGIERVVAGVRPT